jgi:hypothetical protein
MWGAHSVAQALAGLDMTNVSFVEFEYAGPDATMVTRLSNGVKLVLFRVAGSVWDPCQYWHGACGERFDGPEGWAAAADGYSAPDVSAPALMGEYKKVLADYTARTQRPLNHVRDFLDCIRSRRPAVANPDVMCRSMNICLAADICEQLKRNLKFDLRRAEFVGDPEADRMRSRAMRVPYTIQLNHSENHTMGLSSSHRTTLNRKLLSLVLGAGLVLVHLLLAPAASAKPPGYAVVVSRQTHADAGWNKVVEALREKHEATVVVFDTDVSVTLPTLRAQFPRYVCFVAQPIEATRAFVAAVHRLTRRFDDDPYTDCFWGTSTEPIAWRWPG